MKTTYGQIGSMPTVLYGEPCAQGYLFVHGQDGCKEEAAAFAEIAVPAGYQVMGVDLPKHGARRGSPEAFNPWTVAPELQAVFAAQSAHWQRIAVRANSIGAYFSLLAFDHLPIAKALFVSPIVNMERLILDMMGWAGVSEAQLQEQGEIPTDFGQTLSFAYLCFVRAHPLDAFDAPISILYAAHDNLTSRETINAFAKAHGAALHVDAQGEHWYHTPAQLDVLRAWEAQHI